MNDFYVYEWYNIDTNEVFYVGKGCKNRYKNKTDRNKWFIEYINNNNLDSRIVKSNLTEEEAFSFEKQLTEYYKNLNQCNCNLIDGEYGGYSKTWSKEMREYFSQYNPMKSEKQKERMKNCNPMKNPEIAKKVSEKNKRPIIINNIRYDGTVDAAKILGVWENTILNWCKRGYDTEGNPCRYADQKQKEYTIHKTNSKEVIVDGIKYSSLRKAADALGVKDTSPLCKALKAGKKYKGHTCEYANQQPS